MPILQSKEVGVLGEDQEEELPWELVEGELKPRIFQEEIQWVSPNYWQSLVKGKGKGRQARQGGKRVRFSTPPVSFEQTPPELFDQEEEDKDPPFPPSKQQPDSRQ